MEASSPASPPAIDQLRNLYRFMADRDFVAGREELLAYGFSASRIKNWVRSGRLITVVRSVYSYGRDVQTPQAARRAALLVAGPGAALIGRSACEVWGVVNPLQPPKVIQVGAPFGQARQFEGLSPAFRGVKVKVARRDFQPVDILTRDGLRVAKAPLALVDFAAEASDRQVRFAFLEACRLGFFGRADVEYCFGRLVHRRGARKLRPYLALWVPELARVKSAYEGWFLLVWIARGYPMPKVNQRFFGFELDFCWPDYRFGLELDGNAFHSDPVQKQLDREKQLHLESCGLEIERLPYRVFERDPVGEVDRIARQMGMTRQSG